MKRTEMVQRTKEILDHLEYAKKKADAARRALSNSLDIRLQCAVWHEKYSSIVKKKKNKNAVTQAGFKVLKQISPFLKCTSSNFKEPRTDILFLYGSNVHKDIVKDLVSKLAQQGISIVEIKDSIIPEKQLKCFVKGTRYPVNDQICLLPSSSYFSYMKYVGLIAPHVSKIVVSFNETSQAGGIVSHICKRLGSVSVNLAHAISVKMPRFSNSPYDHHFVYGKKSKKNIEESNGIIDGEIIPIGALKMDRFFSLPKTHSLTKKVLIVGSWKGHFLDEVMNYMYSQLLRFVKTCSDFSFVYKPHPLEAETRSGYAQKFADIGSCTVISPDSDLLEVLDSVDAVILGWSTVGLEAASRGKATVVFNPCHIPDWLSYKKSGYGVEASSVDELHSAMAKVYDEYDYYRKKAQEFVNLHLSNPGQATDAMCEALLRILDKHRL